MARKKSSERSGSKRDQEQKEADIHAHNSTIALYLRIFCAFLRCGRVLSVDNFKKYHIARCIANDKVVMDRINFLTLDHERIAGLPFLLKV